METIIITGVCVIAANGREDVRCDETRVLFVPLDESAIGRYVASGEPMDKAGAYAIQGRFSLYVSHLDGCFDGVMGLPLYLVRRLLLEAGYPLGAGAP